MTKKDAVLYPRISKRGPFSAEVSGVEPAEGETTPRRHVAAKNELKTVPHPEITTTFENVLYGAKTFGNARAVGSRRLIKTHVENKKVKKVVDGEEQEVDKAWTYSELSGYSYMSFNEYKDLVLQLGAGLRKLGHEKGSKLHLFSHTGAHWLAMSHGAASQSIIIATAYDSLGEDGLKHSLQQTESESIFLGPSLLPVLKNVCGDVKDLKNVIYDTDTEAKQEDLDGLKSASPHLNVMSFDELQKLGQENHVEPTPPTAEDLCCIMYTSGSTGPPKGVPLKHKNVVAAMAGADSIVGEYLGPSDSLLTYLPQAHILEYVFENLCLYWGGTMGYGNPKTLSDNNVRNCQGDIKEFKPTILVGVPAVWETVKKGIMGNVNKSSAIVKSLFWGGMSLKSMLLSTGLPGVGLVDAIVFRKLKEATGGRLRIMLNGGGPISKDTQRFLSMAVCPMIGGYGLTETAAMGGLNDPKTWNPDAIGELPTSIEVKLVDFADAGYFTNQNPQQGEIWIRGGSVTDSYYKNEEETKASFTSDGWFMTGDIGEFDKHGHIKVIDRKKNLVKSLNGEYIALEKLESIYRSVPVVANICVYAAVDQARPVGIIVPAEPALLQLAKENGIQDDDIGTLINNKKLNSIILTELQNAGRSNGLKSFEIIDGVVLSDEEWTPQNGYTTAAQKLQRKKITNRFQKDIERAYKKG